MLTPFIPKSESRAEDTSASPEETGRPFSRDDPAPPRLAGPVERQFFVTILLSLESTGRRLLFAELPAAGAAEVLIPATLDPKPAAQARQRGVNATYTASPSHTYIRVCSLLYRGHGRERGHYEPISHGLEA